LVAEPNREEFAERMVETAQRVGREGNRWVNTTPSAEELATWFEGNVKVEGELDHKEYVGGVVLIPGTERPKTVTAWNGAVPVIEEVEALILTPYIRVETRLKYFHDLCDQEDWQGFIEPAKIEKQDPKLPPGFFRYAIATGDGRESRYLACSMQVTIYEKGSIEEKVITIDKRTGEQGVVRVGKIVRVAPGGTKAVPTLRVTRSATYADDNAVMKAETGAVGRALGMAGMLVIPGSGIATAEDVQEARAAEAAGPGPDGAALPEEPGTGAVIPETAPGEGTDEKLREDINAALEVLKDQFPETYQAFLAWAKEKKYGRLSETVSPPLRGMHRRVTTMLTEAQQAKSAESGKGSDKPAS
jgi:hypothetical protein